MVGLNVQEPETTCDDPNCPFHGTLPLRGQVLEGIVVSNKAELFKCECWRFCKSCRMQTIK